MMIVKRIFIFAMVILLGTTLFVQAQPETELPDMATPSPSPVVDLTAPAKPAAVTIAAVGDLMVGNWGEALLDQKGVNYPFEAVAPYLQKADIATGNLEGPHCTVGEVMEKTYTFRMKPGHLDGYKWAGFDVFTVGNNHAMDFGPACFMESLSNVQARGMKVCGGGANVDMGNRPAVIEKNGISVAFLGYSATYPKEAWAGPQSPGTIFPERSRVIAAVSEAAKKYDLVVVHFHWGGEGMQSPKDYQRDLAHLVIDNGAALVIGHHPHILQGVESYNGRLIFYSLGNFTFASYSKRAKTSAIAQVTLDKSGKLLNGSVIPVNVYNYEVNLQPRPMPADPAVISEFQTLGGLIGGGTPATITADGKIHID